MQPNSHSHAHAHTATACGTDSTPSLHCYMRSQLFGKEHSHPDCSGDTKTASHESSIRQRCCQCYSYHLHYHSSGSHERGTATGTSATGREVDTVVSGQLDPCSPLQTHTQRIIYVFEGEGVQLDGQWHWTVVYQLIFTMQLVSLAVLDNSASFSQVMETIVTYN